MPQKTQKSSLTNNRRLSYFEKQFVHFTLNQDTDTFIRGLLAILNDEKINYARAMLQGEDREMREDIPCSSCHIYLARKANANWITEL